MGLQAPQIDRIPEVGDGWCQFRWNPPNTISEPIKHYKITIHPLGKEIILDGTITSYRLSSLENGVSYLAQFQASIDGDQWSEIAQTDAFETGPSSSMGPESAQLVSLSSSMVCIMWKPPTRLPDAPIRWYVLESQSTCPSDPVESHTILATQPSQYILKNLTFKGRFRFLVYAVNCPGYSPPTPTNCTFFEQVPDFLVCAEFTPENKEKFINFEKTKLSQHTNTGYGYSYSAKSPNSMFLPVSKLVTNSITYCISICKTGSSVPYAGIMMSRYPEKGTGLCLAGNGATLGYYWNDSPTALPVDTGIPIEDNQWIHLVCTIEPEKVKVYKNAIQVYTQDGEFSPAELTRIFFGRNPVSSSLCFQGLLSNIRLYTRVLSEEEINLIYASVKSI
jgi:hypothetical protein